jgi:hypothetical protein
MIGDRRGLVEPIPPGAARQAASVVLIFSGAVTGSSFARQKISIQRTT